ncbi:amino acid transporter [Ktedonosporobacter rubrisoli]|uniref:Amino acid transporter n=1 Tax=Ktedonosporobacter rubrisoli TaxID=2509675 RepID=A0A4P6K2X0_KTERU|nr:nucleotidyltransferase family protein [Ktedonosporobacter rubrisoli]QBD82272.1 amino acid transporter [Ktedonosporobacter rubrisoli]
MRNRDVLEILNILEQAGIKVWLDGGWGIDALIGRQTRTHSDLDLVINLKQVEQAQQALALKGFAAQEDELPNRIVFQDHNTRQIDFHPVTFDRNGAGIQQLPDGQAFSYAAQGFTTRGTIDGQVVSCISPEVQADCHYGYEPDEDDWHDMQLLRTHFGITLHKPYQ